MSIMSSLMVTFGVKDRGVRENTRVLDETLQSIKGKLDGIKKSQAFSNLIQSLNLSVLSDAKDKLAGLGQEMDGQVDLSSSFASTYAKAEKSLQKTAATAGLTSQEMQKMRSETSFFEALQMDAESVQQTWLRLNDSGLKLQELGFENLQEFMKFTEVSGVEGPKMIRMLERMTKQFDYTQEGARGLIDRVIKVGQSFDTGGAFIQKMPERLTAVQEHFSGLLEDAGPEKINEMTESTFMLAGALEETGLESETALQQSTKVFDKLSQQSQDFEKMLSGAAEDAPKMLKDQLVALGDVKIDENPMEFVRRLRKDYQEADKTGKRFIQGRLLDDLPAGVSQLVQSSMPRLNQKLRQTQKRMQNASGAANELAEAHSTGRTAQERYDRQSELFNNRIHKMSKNMGVVGNMLKMQSEAFDRVGDRVENYVNLTSDSVGQTELFSMTLKTAKGEVTETGEAVQGLTSAWVGYKTAGIRGATIALIEYGKEQGVINEKMAKSKGQVSTMLDTLVGGLPEVLAMVSALSVAGIPGAGLLAPLLPAVLFGGGMLAISQAWKGGLEGFASDAKSFIREKAPELQQKLKGALPGVRESVASFFHQAIAGLPLLVEAGGRFLAPIRDAVFGLFENIDWQGAGAVLRDQVAAPMLDTLGATLEMVDWSAVGGTIGSAAVGLVSFIGEKVIDATPHLQDFIWEATSAAVTGAFGALTESDSVTGSIKKAGTGLTGALVAGMVLAPGLTASVVSHGAALGRMLMGGIRGAFVSAKAGGGIMSGFGRGMRLAGAKMRNLGGLASKIGRVSSAFGRIGKFARMAAKWSGKFLRVLGTILTVGKALWEIPTILKSIKDMFGAASTKGQKSTNKMTDAGWSMANSFYEILDFMTLGLMGWLGSWLGFTETAMKKFYIFLTSQVEKGFHHLGYYMGPWTIETATQWASHIENTFTQVWTDAAEYAVGFFETLVNKARWMVGAIRFGMRSMLTKIRGVFTGIADFITDAVVGTLESLAAIAEKVPGVSLGADIKGLKENVQDVRKAAGLTDKQQKKRNKKMRKLSRRADEKGLGAVSGFGKFDAGGVVESYKNRARAAQKEHERTEARSQRRLKQARKRLDATSKMVEGEMMSQMRRVEKNRVRDMQREGEGGGGQKRDRGGGVPKPNIASGDAQVDAPSSSRGGTPGDSASVVASVNKRGFDKMAASQEQLRRKLDELLSEMRRRQRESKPDTGAKPQPASETY